jgi:hypothetical protein
MNTENTETYRCLADTELEAVNGGEGNVANAAIRTATQWLQDHTYRPGFSWEVYYNLYCHTP